MTNAAESSDKFSWTIEAINRDRATLDEFAKEVRSDAGKFLTRHGAILHPNHVSNAEVEGIGEGQRISENSCVTIDVPDSVFWTPSGERKKEANPGLHIAAKIASLRETGCTVYIHGGTFAAGDHIRVGGTCSIRIPLKLLMEMEISDAQTTSDKYCAPTTVDHYMDSRHEAVEEILANFRT